MKLLLLIAITLTVVNRPVFTAPLVPDFRVLTDLDDLGFYFVEAVQPQSLAISDDGKVWVTTTARVRTDPDTYATVELVLRFLPDGSLDTTFHGNGKLLGVSGKLTALPSGAMLAGSTKIRSDGSIDATFTASNVLGLRAAQQDRKIVSAGHELRRCLPDGQLDTSFSGDGKVPLASDASNIVLQADEKVVVLLKDYTVHRFNSDGSVDVDFGINGTVAIALPSFGGTGLSSVYFGVTSTGNFVIAGRVMQNIVADFAVAQFTPSGQSDAAFGNQGVRFVDGIAPGGLAVPPYSDGFTIDEAYGLHIADDDSIIVGGSSDSSGTMLRLSTRGQLDPFFGGNEGRVLASNPGRNQLRLADFAVGPEHRYCLVGVTDSGSGSMNALALFGFSGGQRTPRLAVESDMAFDPVVSGGNQIKSVIIRNAGNAELRDIVVTKEPSGEAGDFSFGPLSTGTLPSAGTAEFSVTFSPSGPGERKATLLVHSNDPIENPVRVNLSGRNATSLETWRIHNFGSPYDTGFGADLWDADHDGLPNLVEYAVASDPLGPSNPPGQLVKNGNTLEFTYTRRKAALSEVSFVREFSQTLSGTWSQTGSTVEAIVADDGVLQTVRVNTPAGSAGKRFVRLRISRN